jgi:hypothetical protein
MWNPNEHSDQENLQWCWLRAVEWGRWPIFISQIFAPIALLFISWQLLIITTIIVNVIWAIFIRYNLVSVNLAFLGVLAVKLKWLICPIMGFYFFSLNQLIVAMIALFWPLLIFIIGIIPTTQIGIIQNMFMNRLGYERQDVSKKIVNS